MTADSDREVSTTDPDRGFRVQVMAREGVGEVQVVGELDYATAPLLAPPLERLASAGAAITVDLSHLTFCDSQGLDLFFQIARSAREHDGSLTLANPDAALLRLFEVVYLQASIPVVADPDRVASA